jgi:hypothetical protein
MQRWSMFFDVSSQLIVPAAWMGSGALEQRNPFTRRFGVCFQQVSWCVHTARTFSAERVHLEGVLNSMFKGRVIRAFSAIRSVLLRLTSMYVKACIAHSYFDNLGRSSHTQSNLQPVTFRIAVCVCFSYFEVGCNKNPGNLPWHSKS